MPKLEDYELEELYKDFINDTTEIVKIWGMEYEPARVLQEIDPIAYRVGFSDWLDGLDNCEDCDNNPIECECEECDGCTEHKKIVQEHEGSGMKFCADCQEEEGVTA